MIRALVFGLLVGCGSLAPAAVWACLACIEMPKESLADRVIDADAVVLLREDPDSLFRYAVTQVFAGSADDLPPPPFLVDATTRARLAANPAEGVLSSWTDAGGWQHHGVASVALQAVVTRVLDAAPIWQGELERFAFFGPLHADPDEAVQSLALIELARMPYGTLRRLESSIGRRDVAGRLNELRWAEWASIHILLLGLSDDPADAQFVRRAAPLALTRGGQRDLTAWTVAWIEVDGVAAIDAILGDLQSNSARPDGEIVAVALGLLDHANSNPEVAPQALAALRGAATLRTSIAGVAARALIDAEDWSAATELSDLLKTGAVTSPADVFIIENYVELARQQPDSEGQDAKTP